MGQNGGASLTADPRPIVSVVIVSWNTAELLRECLLSLRRAIAEVPGVVETIVVDNASTDETVSIVRREFREVSLIANDANRGFAAATNQAIKRSTGQHVLLLNADTAVEPSTIRVLLGTLVERPSLGAVGPSTFSPQGELRATCFPLPTLLGEFVSLFHLNLIYPRAGYPMRSWPLDAIREVDALEGACIAVRRLALDAVGLLDESFFLYSEEIDLCRRLSESGWGLAWQPKAKIIHHGGASTRQAAVRMFVELYRSKVRFFRKHEGGLTPAAYKVILFAAGLPRILAGAAAGLVGRPANHPLRLSGRKYVALFSRLWSL